MSDGARLAAEAGDVTVRTAIGFGIGAVVAAPLVKQGRRMYNRKTVETRSPVQFFA
jgi:hypothetical protein